MQAISADDFPTAYYETLWNMKICADLEETRNGPAWVQPNPFVLTVEFPWQRVITCPIRNANPFFHVMETVWMFSGSRDCTWLEKFNSNVRQYANNSVIHGAYGHRWFSLWGDQVDRTIALLRDKPNTRQAVIQMWDPQSDWLPHWNDRPCNTQLLFRVKDKTDLEMTVINRSNDMVWGMFGANCVHMSYIHEFIARASGLKQGAYHVFSNNLHFYQDLYPNGKQIWNETLECSLYPSHTAFPVISLADSYHRMRHECIAFMTGFKGVTLPWLTKVAKPMYDCYLAKTPGARIAHASLIEDEAWRVAALQWLSRRYEVAECE